MTVRELIQDLLLLDSNLEVYVEQTGPDTMLRTWGVVEQQVSDDRLTHPEPIWDSYALIRTA